MNHDMRNKFSPLFVFVFGWIFASLPVLAFAQNINTPENFPDPNFRSAVEKFMGVTPGGEFTGETITIPLDLPDNAKPLEMVLIPAGTFMMGSPSSEKYSESDETQHQITLTKPFYIGKYEVTQAQWQAVMGSNPSYFKNNPNNPVEQVSWNDCQTFIQKLNQLGQGTFRLPTEAEWEYACRAGTQTAFYWGEDSSYSQIGEYAWYGGNSSGKTHEVGTKLPNAWGLFDMSGNVWEWCQDWYGSYSPGAQVDPTGAVSGSTRVARGVSWLSDARYCRSAYRGWGNPYAGYGGLGFRLALSRTVLAFAQNINTPENFPDRRFRAAVEKFMGVTFEGAFTAEQAARKTGELDCRNMVINNLKGIEYFINLNTLTASDNLITSVDLSKNIGLVTIRLGNNLLTSLDVSKNINLGYLDIPGNKITSIDVSQNSNLRHFYILNSHKFGCISSQKSS